MKSLILIVLFAAPVLAAGPLFEHKDRFVNQEFDNVYHDMRSLGGESGGDTTSYAELSVSTLTVGGHQGYVLYQSSMICNAASSCTTSNTFTATVSAITITPKRTSSRVVVKANGPIRTPSGSAASAIATIYRSGLNLATIYSGSNTDLCVFDVNSAVEMVTPCSMEIIDTPATTAATTYTVMIRNDNNSSNVCWNAAAVGSKVACIYVEEWGF